MKLFELFATLALNTRDFVKGVNNAGKQAQGLANTVQTKFTAATVAIGNLTARGISMVASAGVKMVKDSLNVVKEFEQNLGGSEAVFGQWAESVQRTGQEAYKNMGLSLSDYLATANKMGSLFKGAGYTTGEAMDMTTKAMQRAADVASIMGVDAEWAMESIAGLAKGNFTMMDNLGVAINDTALANYALEKGIKKSVSAMSTQEKIGLALELFMERTASYAGNYAKENTTLAGSYEVLGAAWDNMLIGVEGSTDAFVDALAVASKATMKNLGEIVPRLGNSIRTAVVKALPKIKTSLSQWGQSAYNAGADIISQIYNGITGATTTATDIKVAIKSVFDFSGIVATGISETAYSVFEWFQKNGESVSSALSLVALGMGAFFLAGHPFALAVGAASGAIVAFSTDWDAVKEKFPDAISKLESITGINFDDFTSSLEKAKTPIAEIADTLANNFVSGLAWINDSGAGTVAAITAIGGAFAKWLLVAHPLASTLASTVSLLGFFSNEGKKVKESSFMEYQTGAITGIPLHSDEEVAALQAYIDAENAYRNAIEALGIGPYTKEDSANIQELKNNATALFNAMNSISPLNIWDTYNNWLNEKNLSKDDALLDVVVGVSDDSEGKIQGDLDAMSLDAVVKLIPDASSVLAAVRAYSNYKTENVPGYATGIDNVPYDNFRANLHRGEAVLTRAQAERWRDGNNEFSNTKVLEGLINTLIDEVKQLSNMTVAMDSVVVGHMVTPTVSRDIALRAKTKHYKK